MLNRKQKKLTLSLKKTTLGLLLSSLIPFSVQASETELEMFDLYEQYESEVKTGASLGIAAMGAGAIYQAVESMKIKKVSFIFSPPKDTEAAEKVLQSIDTITETFENAEVKTGFAPPAYVEAQGWDSTFAKKLVEMPNHVNYYTDAENAMTVDEWKKVLDDEKRYLQALETGRPKGLSDQDWDDLKKNGLEHDRIKTAMRARYAVDAKYLPANTKIYAIDVPLNDKKAFRKYEKTSPGVVQELKLFGFSKGAGVPIYHLKSGDHVEDARLLTRAEWWKNFKAKAKNRKAAVLAIGAGSYSLVRGLIGAFSGDEKETEALVISDQE